MEEGGRKKSKGGLKERESVDKKGKRQKDKKKVVDAKTPQ